MNKKILIFTIVSFSLISMLSCNSKTNAQVKATADEEQKIQVYGVKSGYYKTEMPINESTAETWFDDYGNLQ